jgi:hypothetical protein
VTADYTRLHREVRVTLMARTTTPGTALQGSSVVGGVTAVHGTVTTRITPRAALINLTQATPPQWQ